MQALSKDQFLTNSIPLFGKYIALDIIYTQEYNVNNYPLRRYTTKMLKSGPAKAKLLRVSRKVRYFVALMSVS